MPYIDVYKRQVMLRAPRAAKRFKTLPYAALAQAIRTETLSDEMRVLYVALTRAQACLLYTSRCV